MSELTDLIACREALRVERAERREADAELYALVEAIESYATLPLSRELRNAVAGAKIALEAAEALV